jgi:hypothetical protein
MDKRKLQISTWNEFLLHFLSINASSILTDSLAKALFIVTFDKSYKFGSKCIPCFRIMISRLTNKSMIEFLNHVMKNQQKNDAKRALDSSQYINKF